MLQEFAYKARDKAGKEVKGKMRAESLAHLTLQLKEQGLTLIECLKGAEPAKARVPVATAATKVKMKYIIPFTHHLKVLYGAGIPLITGIENLQKDAPHPSLKRLLENVKSSLEEGNSLSESFAKYPRTFPPIYIAIVRIGEATGNLDQVLGRVADFLERGQETKSRLTQAMIYPLVLGGAVFGLILLLLLFLLPRITDVFEKTNIELPTPTIMLRNISHFITGNILILGGAALALIIFLIMTRKVKALKQPTDKLLLKIPIFGTLLLKDAASSFSYTLSILYKSGVEINEALTYCQEITNNLHIRAMIEKAKVYIENGEPLAVALEDTKVFPPLVMTMVKVGDDTGKLDETLEKVCEFYDREIPIAIKNFMSLLEPAIIFGAGGIVIFIILATLMPIYKIIQVIGKR